MKKVSKFEHLQSLSGQLFRRITGVKRETFELMVKCLAEADRVKKKFGGRPNKLTLEDRVLIALEYWREYRTYAHIAASYGVSESSAFQTICFVENTLIKSKEFRLPGKKALLKSENQFEVILIDATESPIERPKKNSATTIQVKRNAIP